MIVLICVHAPRGLFRAVLFCFSPSHVSVAEQFAFMAEVPAAIPADVLEAARPVADAAAEAPAAGVAEAPAAGAAGENPAPPAQERVSPF